jgi:fatty-acyl-CoA synthase
MKQLTIAHAVRGVDAGVDHGWMPLAHVHGPAQPPLLQATIGATLRAVAQRFGAREALVSRQQDIRMTYAELDAEVDRVARALLAQGIAAGDRVGAWSPNNAEWTLLQLATARIGAILVNVNPAYRTSELAYALRQSGTRLLFAPKTFKTSNYAEMVAAVSPETPALEHVVWIGDPAWDAFVDGGAAVGDAALAEREASLAPGDAINIQYTSGTTGAPKGATLSHTNILNNGYLVGAGCRYTEEDRVCIPVPFYHCFGMVMGNLGAMTHGACMVIPAPAFDAEATLQAVAEERCTSLYGVPTMFIAELGHPDFAAFDLSSLRTGIMAGSPCPVEVMKQVIDDMHMEEVTICYGMTETSPVSTQTAYDDPLDKRVGTVGRVHPHLEVKVVDPVDGATCAIGETGELCTKGYSVMLGYWEDPERTAEVLEDGWMHTGDLATIDAEGYVNIVGRIKDMIIRGGENVYPRELEEFLYGHPDIADVQVIGVPDERYGEELMAWVIARPGAALTEEGVRDYCRGKVAHFKVPRYVKVVDAFPMTVTGKVQKFRLREAAIAELGLEDAARVRTA